MKWLVTFFETGVGKKLLMGFTGLFLILFLVVHLVGNLQLLKDDGGEAFNTYAHFMTTNPLIKVIAYGNYFFLLLHAFVGISLAIYNRKAKGKRNAVAFKNPRVTWASQNMALLGMLILAFLFMHMGDFWFKMKTGQLNVVDYGNGEVKDLFSAVSASFKELWIVIAYVIGQIVLAYHLWHGFQSAFQSLGVNHIKYTPFIKQFGKWYSILIPLGFAILPLYYYFFK
ncbi:MAG: succinate dehydrogenase cytochrome b subunit [Saprospiraceae bacterium]|nr:MAG: succinate dehydrogenase (or fumarate reductase) cytochrome b subunit, b558 family [Bacteroidetes bacterium OLB9]MCO6463114.1 succinate dehydrogenase cytochrome b subunit [Saprospiraceae bacterium]MCZ2337936.1 succinate dehydrogenase cytochrome b subunit [Chitinophagales bacterium]